MRIRLSYDDLCDVALGANLLLIATLVVLHGQPGYITRMWILGRWGGTADIIIEKNPYGI